MNAELIMHNHDSLAALGCVGVHCECRGWGLRVCFHEERDDKDVCFFAKN